MERNGGKGVPGDPANLSSPRTAVEAEHPWPEAVVDGQLDLFVWSEAHGLEPVVPPRPSAAPERPPRQDGPSAPEGEAGPTAACRGQEPKAPPEGDAEPDPEDILLNDLPEWEPEWDLSEAFGCTETGSGEADPLEGVPEPFWEFLRDPEEDEDRPVSGVPDDALVDVDTDGRAPDDVRAYRAAEVLAREFGWGAEAVGVLAEVLGENGWSATQAALRRLAEEGLEPHELPLVAGVREIWHSHPEFGLAFVNGGVGGDWVESWSQRYRVLSWPVALEMARGLGPGRDLDEVERFLEALFHRWFYSDPLRRDFPSFQSYARYRLTAHPVSASCDLWSLPLLADPFEEDDRLDLVLKTRLRWVLW